MRRANSLRIGVHHADAVVWGPVYRTHLIHDGGRGSRRERLDDAVEVGQSPPPHRDIPRQVHGQPPRGDEARGVSDVRAALLRDGGYPRRGGPRREKPR
jgi:hypothetical protein